MSVEIVINPRANDLGDGLKVRRALPFMKKRMVGPFIFLDHMGPAHYKVGSKMKVRSHPHIGLSTLTYLFSGEILHRDTLGYEQPIRPGEVNWMTAGKGIAHSETAEAQGQDFILEGIQFWVALPKDKEDIEPSFVHKSAKDVPVIIQGRSRYHLVAGSALGKTSPVPTYSPLFYLNGEVEKGDSFSMPLDNKAEGAIYVAKGEVEVEGQSYGEGNLICFHEGSSVDFRAGQDSVVAILGGEVFLEKRYIFWNFVSSSEEKIEAAKLRWQQGEFGQVINETEFIPLPTKS